jgi:hypothetical protein
VQLFVSYDSASSASTWLAAFPFMLSLLPSITCITTFHLPQLLVEVQIWQKKLFPALKAVLLISGTCDSWNSCTVVCSKNDITCMECDYRRVLDWWSDILDSLVQRVTIHYYTRTYTGVHRHVFTSRCSVAASNGGRSPSGFPHYPQPQLPTAHNDCISADSLSCL